MWPLKKKEDTVESLMKDCNKLYSSFNYSLTLANSINYAKFKVIMKNNFKIMQDMLSKQTDEVVTLALLKNFKEQLSFFEKNPFYCDQKEFIKSFDSKYMPYQQKLDELISETIKNKQPKMKKI